MNDEQRKLKDEFHKAVDTLFKPLLGAEEYWLKPECSLLAYTRQCRRHFDDEDRETLRKLERMEEADYKYFAGWLSGDRFKNQAVGRIRALVHAVLAVMAPNLEESVSHAAKCLDGLNKSPPLTADRWMGAALFDQSQYTQGAKLFQELPEDPANPPTASVVLAFQSLLDYLLNVKPLKPSFSTFGWMPLVGGGEKERVGVVKRTDFDVLRDYPFGVFLDPVWLGMTLIDERMARSIRRGWAIVRKALMPQDRAADRPTQPKPPCLRLRPDVEGVWLLEGGSAGGLLVCGMYAAAKGNELDPNAAASFGIELPEELEKLDADILPKDVSITTVDSETLWHKLTAAERHAKRVALCGKQKEGLGDKIENWDQWTPRARRLFDKLDIVGVDNIAQAYDALTGDARSDRMRPSVVCAADFDFHLLERATTASHVFGREHELEWLGRCLRESETSVVVLHAFGGFGKTALVKEWIHRVRDDGWCGMRRGFGYSFYRQGQTDLSGVDSTEFFELALEHFKDPDPLMGELSDKAKRLVPLVAREPAILVIDGTEVIQNPLETDQQTQFRDAPFNDFLNRLLEQGFRGLCVVTTRYNPADFSRRTPLVASKELVRISDDAARQLLVDEIGVRDDTVDGDGRPSVDALINDYEGYPMGLELVGQYLVTYLSGDPRRRDVIPHFPTNQSGHHALRVISAYEEALVRDNRETELFILKALAIFDRPIRRSDLYVLTRYPVKGLSAISREWIDSQWTDAVGRLHQYRLVSAPADGSNDIVGAHPLVRYFFRKRLTDEAPRVWATANRLLFKATLKDCPPRISAVKNVEWTPREVRRRQMDAALKIACAIRHAAAAGHYWDALAIVTARLDEQEQVASESALRALFPIWAFLTRQCHLRWPLLGLLKVAGAAKIGPLAFLYTNRERVDRVTGFYLAKRLLAWELRLSIASEFYPGHDFSQEPRLCDPLAAAMLDMATSYCLACIGRTLESIQVAERVLCRFEQLSVRPGQFLAAFGLAILELHTGRFEKAVSFASDALRLAESDRQQADCLVVRAFAKDVMGNLGEAETDIQEASLVTTQFSARALYLELVRKVRHAFSIREAEEYIERRAREEPAGDEDGPDLERRTIVINSRLFLARRKCADGWITPQELIHLVQTAFDELPEGRSSGFYQKAILEFHHACACARKAAMPCATDEDKGSATAALAAAERLATSGGFQPLVIDVRTARAELLVSLGESHGKELAGRVLDEATRLGYAWGVEDAEAILSQ